MRKTRVPTHQIFEIFENFEMGRLTCEKCCPYGHKNMYNIMFRVHFCNKEWQGIIAWNGREFSNEYEMTDAYQSLRENKKKPSIYVKCVI